MKVKAFTLMKLLMQFIYNDETHDICTTINNNEQLHFVQKFIPTLYLNTSPYRASAREGEPPDMISAREGALPVAVRITKELSLPRSCN